MSARHVIFDLDGTLIDSAPSILSGFARVLDQHGISPRCELTQALIGPPLIVTLRQISGIDDPVTLQGLAHDFKCYYDEVGYRETLEYPGCTELLHELGADGAHLYIATNKRITPTRKIIKWLGWTDLFQGIYSQDAFDPVLNSKANVIARILKVHGIAKKFTVYVGDRDEDREAATICGLRFLGALWGYGARDQTLTDTMGMRYPSEIRQVVGLSRTAFLRQVDN
jgi:phosphoglycolate phosphatase